MVNMFTDCLSCAVGLIRTRYFERYYSYFRLLIVFPRGICFINVVLMMLRLPDSSENENGRLKLLSECVIRRYFILPWNPLKIFQNRDRIMRPKLYSLMAIQLLETVIEVLLTKVGLDILKKISIAIMPVKPVCILTRCKKFAPATMLLTDTRPFSNGHVTNGEEYDFKRNPFRPRLISESSVDSEDNYDIVFETDSDDTYKSDFDCSEATESSDDSDNENECEITQSESTSNYTTRKVTFNLTPVVHTMVQWDYAYRAARKGPWEEMARDRERFKGRIDCIGCVLEPVLEIEHRTHIWQERFA